MKKTLATLLISLLSLSTMAADTHPAFLDTSRPASIKPEFTVHVGVGASTITQNYSDQIEGCTEFFLTPGCRTAFGATAGIPIRDWLSINTGIDIAINNFNYSMTIVDAPNGTLNSIYNRSHYSTLEIPLYVQFRFNLGSKIRWINDLGGYISHGMGGSAKYHAYISSTNDLGQSQVTESRFSHKYYNAETPLIARTDRTDYGLHLATGLLYKRHFSLKCVLRAGFPNIAKNLDVLDISTHNVSATFLIGYTF